jgi:anti-sigma factor RsiW
MISRGDEQDGHGRVPAPVLSGHVDDWAELAVDYLDGRVTPEVKAAVQSHLLECPACAARLGAQQSVVAFLQQTYLDDPPLDLEDRVLGEVLFPSQPVAPPRKEEPQGWSVTWNKKIRPWLPATIAVVALMGAVIGYGVIKSDGNVTTEVADTSQPGVAAEAVAETTAGGGTLAGAPTTAAAATTTLAVAESTESTTVVSAADGPPEPEVVVDQKAMVAGLRDAEDTAYLTFMAAAPEQPEDTGSSEVTTTTAAAVDAGGVSQEQANNVASQITALTGLTQLPQDLSLGGPTFAAYLSREDADKLVDLVRSIGASVQLVVGLIVPLGTADITSRLLENKRELCELIAQRTAKPSTANWNFTTSTLPLSGDQQDDPMPPEKAGTHVLVVIYVRSP